MKVRSQTVVAALAAAAALSAAGAASAATITGGLYFGTNPNNYYNPANNGVPPGYGNVSSDTVAIGPGVEFGYQDGANKDTADFTNTSLTIQDITYENAANWTQTFTASTAGFFNSLHLASDTLGVSYSVVGDTLTVTWPGDGAPQTAAATFTFTGGGVPEPAAWAMMMVGIGCIGGAVRIARRNQAAVAA